MKRTLRGCLAGFAVLVCSATIQDAGVVPLPLAQTPTPQSGPVYEQPVDSEGRGMYSNFGGQEVANQFVLPQAATVSGVIWYGYFARANPPADFKISIFPDSSGMPAQKPSYERIVRVRIRDSGMRTTRDPLPGRTIYEFIADSIPPFSVEAGVKTWISITTTVPPTINWLWSQSSETKVSARAIRSTNPDSQQGWGVYRSRDLAMAFRLFTVSVTIKPLNPVNP